MHISLATYPSTAHDLNRNFLLVGIRIAGTLSMFAKAVGTSLLYSVLTLLTVLLVTVYTLIVRTM